MILMAFDLKEFQKDLAHNKVYNAWQYVESLCEILSYMTASYELIDNVYSHRVNSLKSKEQEIMQKAISTGKATVTESDFHCTDLSIAGVEIDDILYLKKTTIEFFHYARINIDILFQIINAALFGDDGFDDSDRKLIAKVNKKLDGINSFSNLKSKLDDIKANDTFKYLQAFDNYNKHIKTILVSIKNSFLIGNNCEFTIKAFSYTDQNVTYQYGDEDALTKIREVKKYVEFLVDDILAEIQQQIPNCLDNSSRIQNIKYEMQFKETENGEMLDYMSFFIEVEKDISELPGEIKVLPLIVKPNDEIYSFDFRFDKIFIKLKGADENAENIIGYATLKSPINSNEFYRTFTVTTCDHTEYTKYLLTFKDTYSGKFNMNFYAMEGTMLFYKE